MTKQEIKVDIYSLGNDFMVEIDTTDVLYEAWLYNIRYGVKSYLFGVDKNDESYDDFVASIEIAVYNDHYIDEYKEEYMD